MFRRLLALLILLGLVGATLYYWKATPGAFSRPGEAFGAIRDKLRDTKTASSVKAALELNREVGRFPVKVTASGDGVVTLRGEVPSTKTKATAGRLAEAVPGVRRVVNQIAVDSHLEGVTADRTLGENLDDRALEAKVHLAFSLNRGLEGSDLSVRAYRREVVLSGTVDGKAQRALAVEIAENAPEVVRVKSAIRLRGEPAEPATGGVETAEPASRVERALSENPNLRSYRISVAEKDGRMVLEGLVKTGAEKELAGYVAREAARCPVDNGIRIGS